MKASELLRRAQEILNAGTWRKDGSAFDALNRPLNDIYQIQNAVSYSAGTALNVAAARAGLSPWADYAYRYLAFDYDDNVDDVVQFNDDPNTTLEDVLFFYDLAIVRAQDDERAR